MRYAVNEHFLTFQGEGLNQGKRAYFIRLQGCDLSCSFCDSAGTWHPLHRPPDVAKLTPEEISALIPVELGPGTLVVITGGEPTLYDLRPLLLTLTARGLCLALETAGHHPIRDVDLWHHVCISPKPRAEKGIYPGAGWLASEWKLIITEPQDIARGLEWIAAERIGDEPVWLHPEWSQRENQTVLRAIRDAVLRDKSGIVRAGYQIHKLYRCDEMSGQARPDVPLGGLIR